MSSDGAPRSARPSLISVVRLLGDPEVKFHILDVTLAFFWCFFPQKEERGVGSRQEGSWVDKET